jgi:hypothetical protein
MKSRLRLLLAPLALLSSPALAQIDVDALPPPDPVDAEIRNIVAHGPQGIDIAPDRRADLSGCEGTTALGVLQAIQSCWPVLETYRANAPLVAAIDAWMQLPPAGQTVAGPESRTAVAAAEHVIAQASPRLYPAQDVPLMIAHMALAMIDGAQGNLESTIAHFTTARQIHASSRITADKFTGGGDDIDRQIAETRAEQARREASGKK